MVCHGGKFSKVQEDGLLQRVYGGVDHRIGWSLCAVLYYRSQTGQVVSYDQISLDFYNAPDGEEQTVMFLDDAPDAPALDEVRQEGERWLDFSKVKVEAPVNGWAKVDIGDDGAPLYVEQEYVTSEEASLFEGRKASNSFMATGVRNLPPAGWMWLMGISLYFFLFY